jgi:DNA-binding MurR/RpiR family transcriptional regulator
VNATDTFAERIANRRDQLAPAERQVADWLAVGGPDLPALSAAAMAERVGTSDATIVRTAKALGYTGLAELRLALARREDQPALDERLRRTLDQAGAADDLLQITLRNHLLGLEAMSRIVTASLFEDAADHLERAARVAWRGVGPSAHLARYGQLLFQRIGKPSIALVHTGTSFADELLSLRAGDAVALLAYGRRQRHVRVLLERAAALDLPVVLITDGADSRVAPARGTVLRSGRGAPGLFASHSTTLVLIEALVLAVAAASRAEAEASLRALNDLRAELAGRRIDVDVP